MVTSEAGAAGVASEPGEALPTIAKKQQRRMLRRTVDLPLRILMAKSSIRKTEDIAAPALKLIDPISETSIRSSGRETSISPGNKNTYEFISVSP
jgi:hypothetical protein